MPRSNKSANPFYALLVIAGITFALTATAYGVMAFRDRDSHPTVSTDSIQEHPLMTWMSRHGEAALMTEVAILAVCTFGAIGTDDYWQRRDKRSEERGARSRE